MYYPDLGSFLCANLPGYADERSDTQQLINKILFLPNPDYRDSSAISISTAYLRELGHSTSTFHRVNSKYGFYTFSKHYRKGQARKAYPNPIVSELLCKYSLMSTPVDVMYTDTARNHPITHLAEYSEGSIVVVGGLEVNATVKVDERCLMDYIYKGSDNALTMDVATKYLRMCHTNQFPQGVIPQAYRTIPNGRVVGVGLTVQNAKRCLRTALMNGYWDYDFTCCHYAVLSRYGASEVLQNYVSSTSQVREMLARELNVDVDSIKKCLLSIIYGATKGKHPEKCAIASYIGPHNVDAFWSNNIVKSLIRSIHEAAEELMGTTEYTSKDLANKLMTIESDILVTVTENLKSIVPPYSNCTNVRRVH